MELTCVAHAGIGVRLRDYDLLEEVDVRTCSHWIGGGWGFCPKCQKPAYKTIERQLECFDQESLDEHGFVLLKDANDPPFCYLLTAHVSAGNDNDHCGLKSVDVEEVVEQLRLLLEPNGLWDEDGFGVWIVQVPVTE